MPVLIVGETGGGARFELDVNDSDAHIDNARIVNNSSRDCVATVTSTIDSSRNFKHVTHAGDTQNHAVQGIVRAALGGTLTGDGYRFDAIFQFNSLPAGMDGNDF